MLWLSSFNLKMSSSQAHNNKNFVLFRIKLLSKCSVSFKSLPLGVLLHYPIQVCNNDSKQLKVPEKSTAQTPLSCCPLRIAKVSIFTASHTWTAGSRPTCQKKLHVCVNNIVVFVTVSRHAIHHDNILTSYAPIHVKPAGGRRGIGRDFSLFWSRRFCTKSHVQWNPVNTTTFGPWQVGRIKGVL